MFTSPMEGLSGVYRTRLERMGLSFNPNQSALLACGIGEGVLKLNFNDFLRAFGIGSQFVYNSHFDAKQKCWVVTQSRLILTKNGEVLTRPEFQKIWLNRLEKIPTRFWRSPSLYRINDDEKEMAICEVDLSVKDQSEQPLWTKAKLVDTTEADNLGLYWIYEMLAPVFWQFDVKAVDSTWLTRNVFTQYHSPTDCI